jgi:hypothetical protein
MKHFISNKSIVTFRRFSAGMLALLMSVAYVVPIWASCVCCGFMNIQPTSIEEIIDTETPSCHAVIPIGDGSTEEIASAKEEIASATEEIASATEEIFNGCNMDCMVNGQVPAAVALGVVESHSSSNHTKAPVFLSDLVYTEILVNNNGVPNRAEALSICPIHPSTASVPLRI